MFYKIFILISFILSHILLFSQNNKIFNPKVNSSKHNIFVLALNGAECSCDENSLKLTKTLKQLKKDSAEVVIVTNDLTKKHALSTLKYVYELDFELYKDFNVYGSKRLFNKLSDGTNSHLNVIYNRNLLMSKQLSLIDNNDLYKFKYTYKINHQNKVKLSKEIKEKIFLAGNYIYSFNDSLLISHNSFYKTFFTINLNQNEANKLINKKLQNKIMKEVLPLISRDIHIDSFKINLDSTGKHFFNIENISKIENTLYTLGNITNPNDKYLNDWFNNNILITSDVLGNVNQIYNIERPKAISYNKTLLNNSFSTPFFSKDTNDYFYFTIYMKEPGINIDTTSSNDNAYPFVARYKHTEDDKLDFDCYLNLDLPEYYIKNEIFYYNNFVGFFEYQGMSYLYFKHLPYLYNLTLQEVIKVENLSYEGLDIAKGTDKQVKPFEIKSVNETVNSDIGLIIQQNFKNYLLIIDSSNGKQIAKIKLKGITGNTACDLDLNNIYCLKTPFFRNYKFYKLNYTKN